MPSSEYAEHVLDTAPSDASMRLLEDEDPDMVRREARQCYLDSLRNKFDPDDPARMFGEMMADKWWPIA